MSLNFSLVREILCRKADIALHRQVFIFAGSETWQKDTLKEILHEHESSCLWVGEHPADGFPATVAKKAHSWLGKEKQIVVFDANNYFEPDAFAAISGIVIGGGLFILLMPSENKWNEIYSSLFGQRLIQSIKSSTAINIIKQGDEKITLVADTSKSSNKKNCDFPYLTIDQQEAVENIKKEVLNKTDVPIVLISDRGRGKSAALGITAANLMEAGIKNIIITAPRLRATDIVFKHIEQLLPEAEVKRGQITLKNSVIQFIPPDQLQLENTNADLLLVDEAASIPVPLLTSFLEKFPQCIFSTTVHGYEGTGRGFSVRFNKILNKQKPSWKKLEMQQPIRWAENDPLEQWMFDLLCLDAEIPDKELIGKIDSNDLEISLIESEQLAKNEELLKNLFSLLVLAHYRTRPSDLQRLLDDQELSIYIVKSNQHIIAIALVNHEGKFSNKLSTEIYRGERRPPGNLLAQALTYHCGVENAATLNYARVMRIAVHPELQGQTIGSNLLDFIITNEKKSGCDAIGSSFGMNTELLNFWKKADFNVIRIGFTREQTSGEHAAIMMKPLSQAGNDVYSYAYKRFFEQLPFWFDDVLKSLPNEIKDFFQLMDFNREQKLTEPDEKDLESFVKYSRNYELCIAALSKLVLAEQNIINNSDFQEKFKTVLHEKVINKKDWKRLSGDMNLTGKNEARSVFHQAIIYLLETSPNSYLSNRG